MDIPDSSMTSIPNVGDLIYFDDMDVTHGSYIRGGWGKVQEIYRDDRGRAFVSIEECPGATWAWDDLGPKQDYLKSEFGTIQAGKYIMNFRLDDRTFPGPT